MAVVLLAFILAKRRKISRLLLQKWDMKACKVLGKALLKLSLPS